MCATCVFLVFHAGRWLRVVFSHVNVFPVDIVLTELAIQCIAWCIEVGWKLLGSVSKSVSFAVSLPTLLLGWPPRHVCFVWEGAEVFVKRFMGGSQALATPRNVLPGTVPLSYQEWNFSQITVTVDLVYFGQFHDSDPPLLSPDHYFLLSLEK